MVGVSGVPNFRKESSETGDKAKLHQAVDTHPITERFMSLDLPTEHDASRTGSDDVWNLHSEVLQNQGYPAAMNDRKGAQQV